jgi:hypothetical protein
MSETPQKPEALLNAIAAQYSLPKSYVKFADRKDVDPRIRNKVIGKAGISIKGFKLYATEVLAMSNTDILLEYKKILQKKSEFSVQKRRFIVYMASCIVQHERDLYRAEKDVATTTTTPEISPAGSDPSETSQPVEDNTVVMEASDGSDQN